MRRPAGSPIACTSHRCMLRTGERLAIAAMIVRWRIASPPSRARTSCSTPTIPVDWYPWGERGVRGGAPQRQADLPVDRLLDLPLVPRDGARVVRGRRDVAEVLNARLRRRSRSIAKSGPDVDRVYMTFVQATTGSGGWPMSVWLTPDLRAVLRRHLLPADLAVGPAGLHGRAARDRARLARGAAEHRQARPAEIVARLARSARGHDAAGHAPDAGALDETRRQFAQSVRHAARRLRRRAEVPAAERAAVPAARARAHRRRRRRATMVLQTLRAMALGGMRDHIGGGFHRYSVDGSWRVPHFEKMLYDQAQLVLAYLEGCAGEPAIRSSRRSPRTRCSTSQRDMTDAGRRLLLGRGRRQRAAWRQRDVPARAQDGRRLLPLDARRGRGALLGRRRASPSSAASASSPAATRRSIRTTSSPARTSSTPPGRSPTSRANWRWSRARSPMR